MNWPKKPYWIACGFVKENAKTIWVYVAKFGKYIKVKKNRVRDWVDDNKPFEESNLGREKAIITPALYKRLKGLGHDMKNYIKSEKVPTQINIWQKILRFFKKLWRKK